MFILVGMKIQNSNPDDEQFKVMLLPFGTFSILVLVTHFFPILPKVLGNFLSSMQSYTSAVCYNLFIKFKLLKFTIYSHQQPRPKSTNVVKIDTDVTITGVTITGVRNQETICKTLKYRTAYSVTEECVVSRPPTQEPPKSYTPLSALTNMRPPGGQIPPEPCKWLSNIRS